MAQGEPVEREVKLAVADPAQVEARLRALQDEGAVFEGVEREINDVLDTSDGVLASRMERLRLRTVEGQDGVRVTWKGPARAGGEMKEREEQEYRADHAETCAAVFRRLGFVPVLTYRKQRATWHWRGLSITLDRLDFGTFVEIEIERGAGAEEAEHLLTACISRLGLTDAPRVEASYAVLQEEWDRRQSK
jgi:predicted adenylyl cyclase CyaB